MTVLSPFLYFIGNSMMEVIKVIEIRINILKNFYIILPKKKKIILKNFICSQKYIVFEYFIFLKIDLKRKDIKHNSKIKKYKKPVLNNIIEDIYGIIFFIKKYTI